MKVFVLFALLVLGTFADPKKGVGCDAGCSANTILSMKAGWYYNWGGQPNVGSPVPFVPMCYSLHKIDDIPNYSDHLLGFNEPDHAGTAQASPQQAYNGWQSIYKKAYTIASPAMAGNAAAAGSWLEQFMKLNPKVDYIAVHWYGGSNVDHFKQRMNQIYSKYNKPIWITEFACQDHAESSNPLPQSQVNAFMDAAIPWIQQTSWIHRYCWHNSGIGTSALWTESGSLTQTGRRYSNF